MLPYSWWVAEKGYQNLRIDADEGGALKDHMSSESVTAVRQWLKLASWDAIFGYLAAGLVASVFMIVGAEVLKPRGIVVDGLPVVQNIAAIFTETFGGWSYLLFMVPAFAAIYSTVLGVFDGGRMAIAHIVRMLMKRKPVPLESMRTNTWYRVSLVLFSLVPLVIFLGVQQPVALVITAGVISAVSMPFLAAQVFWSLVRQIPPAYRPNRFYLGNLLLSIVVYVFFTCQAFYQLAEKWLI
jgi:Mn2+/Fe2+ NRAMP family transporter